MDKNLVSAFRFFLDRAGYATPPGRAACALMSARAEIAYQARQAGSFDDPEDGMIRFRWEWDESCTFDDAWGDTFNRKANPDVQESRMAREEKAAREAWKREGAVGCILEVFRAGKPACDSCGRGADPGAWEHAASLWGIVESGNTRERNAYRRLIQAELASEAFHHA